MEVQIKEENILFSGENVYGSPLLLTMRKPLHL